MYSRGMQMGKVRSDVPEGKSNGIELERHLSLALTNAIYHDTPHRTTPQL